jgi:hypothetical protein
MKNIHLFSLVASCLILTNIKPSAQTYNRIFAESHVWLIAGPGIEYYSLDTMSNIYFDNDSSDYYDPISIQNFEHNYNSPSYNMPDYDQFIATEYSPAKYIVKAQADSSVGKFVNADWNMDYHAFTRTTYLTHNKPLHYTRLMYDSLNVDSFYSDEEFFEYNANQQLTRDSILWSSSPGNVPYEGAIIYRYDYDANGNKIMWMESNYYFATDSYHYLNKNTYTYDAGNVLQSFKKFQFNVGISDWDTLYNCEYYYSPSVDSIIIWAWNSFLASWIIDQKEFYYKNMNGDVNHVIKDDYWIGGYDGPMEEKFKFYGPSNEYLGDSTVQYFNDTLRRSFREVIQRDPNGHISFINCMQYQVDPFYIADTLYSYYVERDLLHRPNKVTYMKRVHFPGADSKLFDLDKYYWDSYTLSNTNLPSVLPLLIFPNPSHESVILDVPENAEKICLYDMNGKLIRDINHFTKGSMYLDVSLLQNGLYVLNVFDKSNQLIHRGKFIKN